MAMSVGTSGEGEVMVEMNTTPLIDVMLVLLTLLIITLPIQTHAVKLDMPAGNGGSGGRFRRHHHLERPGGGLGDDGRLFRGCGEQESAAGNPCKSQPA